jgi:hypothetical protein
MTPGLRDTALLLGALLLSAAPVACGIVRDVLTSPEDGGIDAGPGSSGAGNGVFTDGGLPSRSGRGGAAGQGGQGTGGDGGSSTASGGAADSDADLSSAGGNGAVLARLDPHATERKELAQQLCGLLDKYPCLTLETGMQVVSPADQATYCQNLTESVEVIVAGNNCWNEWVAQIQCELARTDWCPCTDYCYFHVWDGDTPSHCTDTKALLDRCEAGNTAFDRVTGKAGTYEWSVEENGTCGGVSVLNPKGLLEARCTGPANGPQTCSCYVNGVFIGDQAEYVHNGGSFSFWSASDCPDVAQQLAVGKCSDILNCCFTWTYNASPDAGPVEDCGCTADPTQAGYDSCEAMAAAGHGKVIDFCPRYRPDPGSFP